MKFTLTFIVLALGTVICTTYSPNLARSETNKHEIYDGNGLGKALKQIVNLQQFFVDDSKHDLSNNDMEVAKASGITTNSGSSAKGDRRGDVTTTSRRTDETAPIEAFTKKDRKLNEWWLKKFENLVTDEFDRSLQEFIIHSESVINEWERTYLGSKGVIITPEDSTLLHSHVKKRLKFLSKTTLLDKFKSDLWLLDGSLENERSYKMKI